MMGTGFLGAHPRHLPTSLSPTMPGSIGLRWRRGLYERWDGSDGSDTAAECASHAQPDRELPRPCRLGRVRVFGRIVGERRARSPRGAGPITGCPGLTHEGLRSYAWG